MRHERAFVLGILLAACGPAATPAASGGTSPACRPGDPGCPGGDTVVAVTPASDAGAPVAATSDAGAPAPSADAHGPLPPPKPTVVPLAGAGHDPVDAELDQGDAAMRAGDLAAAAKHYEAARKLGPRRPGPAVGLARVRVAKTGVAADYGAGKGNAAVAAAIKDLKRVTAHDKTYGPAWAELGFAQLLASDAQGALTSMRKAAELLPDEPEVVSALGAALLATGHKDEALPQFARAVALDPGSAPRRGNLGAVELMMGRVNDAVQSFEVAARIAPDDARAHDDLGTALLAKNDVTRGANELERAVQLDASRPSYHVNLGYAYGMLGRRPDAVAQYREAIRLDPTFTSAWISLGVALAQDPKTRAEARAALLKAKALDPSDPRVKENLNELDTLEKGKP